jgi:predicted ABC-type ATPase
MKQVIIIAGPNGSGKTTFANEFLPKEGDTVNFLNADLIALGISPFAPEKVAIEASKILLSRIDECCRRKESFGVETTLSGRIYLKKINVWKNQGYMVTLHFLKLASVELAEERVNMRVKHGGHFIPQDVIRRRYSRGLKLLPAYKDIVDEWKIWDTSQGTTELIDEG